MLARCPYPDCGWQFEVAGQERRGICGKCSRECTAKPLEVWREIDRQWQRYQQQANANNQHAASAAPLLTVIAEDIRSLWNVGSIFRTADGAGISHLYLCGITGIPPRKQIAKTSLGAEDSVPWQYARHALEPIASLKAQRITIVALERTAASMPLSDVLKEDKLKPPVCLVVGNEVTGISLETLSACDYICHLPMHGVKESLNVSVAFGVAAYMLSHRYL